jgi:hypothetical protein
MTNLTVRPRSSSRLVLLCACVVVLAWAAPLLADAFDGSPHNQSMNTGQPATDLVVSHSQTVDVTDEPVILVSIGSTAVHMLTFSLRPVHLTKWTWSPLPPVRPPSVLKSI